MKKEELKNRIGDGFSELAPNVFDNVMATVEERKINLSAVEQEEIIKPVPRRRFAGYAMSVCAALVVICLCLFGVFEENKTSVYMVLDINPSIQIEMDKSYHIKNIKGLNEDGKNVVKELKWKKKESIQDLMGTLIKDVVDKSYLRENEGILVTLSASDNKVCRDLENKLGECIDNKLEELKVNGVTTAFQKSEKGSAKKGRQILESELAENYGVDENQAKQMSVMELINYCQDSTSLKLDISKKQSKEETEPTNEEPEKQTTDKLSSTENKRDNKESDDKNQKEEDTKESSKKDNISESSTTESTESQEDKAGKNTEPENKEPEEADSAANDESVQPTCSTPPNQQTEPESSHQTQAGTEKQTELKPTEDTSERDSENTDKMVYGDYIYDIISDGTVEIIKYTGMEEKIKIPAAIEGKTVTHIGMNAFSGNANLKSVILSNGVMSIGEGAFSNCVNLNHVKLPIGISQIQNDTFYGCTSLRRIVIPDSVIDIGEYAFYNCSNLRRIRLSAGMARVGASAFEGCSKLKWAYYNGTMEKWNNIDKGVKNEYLENAVVISDVVIIRRIKLTAPAKKIIVGSKASVTAVIRPANADNQKLKWRSSNSEIASVDENGIVTAKAKGKVRITARTTDGSKKRASIILRIIEADDDKDNDKQEEESTESES